MIESATFPRSVRIRRHAEFQRVQRSAHLRVPEKAFLLLARVGDTTDDCRLGLVASKKLGGAVERNRGKRLMRDVFRRWRGRLPKDLDLVVILHPQVLEHSSVTLERDFARAVGRLRRERERFDRKTMGRPADPA